VLPRSVAAGLTGFHNIGENAMMIDPAKLDTNNAYIAWQKTPTETKAGHGFSMIDLPAQWQSAYQNTYNLRASPADNKLMSAIIEPLNTLNDTAGTLHKDAAALNLKGDATPAEIVHLTMRCHEYLFRCELTSNVANRCSDDISQLFRQQS
jgi:hypothetical protein